MQDHHKLFSATYILCNKKIVKKDRRFHIIGREEERNFGHEERRNSFLEFLENLFLC